MLSLLGENKLDFLLSQLKFTKDVPGDIAEIGVYRGGALLEICKTTKGWQKMVHGYDSFEGLPEPTEDDLHKQGEFKADFDEVKMLLKDQSVALVKGWYPESARHGKLSFVHLDIDLSEPTRIALSYLSDKISLGGVMLIDDYFWRGTPPIGSLVHSFLESSDGFKVRAANLHQISLERVK